MLGGKVTRGRTDDMTAPATRTAYQFDNAWEHARTRLAALELVHDPATIHRLEDIGVGPGWRCLEVGAGGGSITRWLCDRVAPTGSVRAVDLDTRFVEAIDAPNLTVERFDVTAQELPMGAYDLVHARCVLCHLPSREQVLDELAASLRPGGWLLIEDPSDHASRAFGPALHGEIMTKVEEAFVANGATTMSWSRGLPSHLQRRGLVDVHGESNVALVEGGTPGTEFLRLTAIQLREQAVAAGTTVEQIDEWQMLLETPGEWFGTWAHVAAWGRRPEPTR
jgi:2-polyprenyl-3-methyl-5-hydroxy-6-metoxy-1,4-benzoquinol methylase